MQIFVDALVLILLSVAVCMDFHCYRIPNMLIVSAVFTGIGLNIYQYGMNGAGDSAAGCLIPFLIFFPVYALSMIGAGDVKLLMAVGAITGLTGSVISMIAAFFIGAVISFTLMIKYHNFLKRLKFFFHYLILSKSSHVIRPYYNLKKPEKGETLHFSLCIALGHCVYLFIRDQGLI